MFFSLNSHTHLEVKWANIHKGNSSFFKTPHSNPHYNIILVIDGPVYLELDSVQLTLQSGEFLLLATWQVHQGWKAIEEHAGFFWIQFSSDIKLELIDDKVLNNEDFHLLMPESNELRTFSGNQIRILIPQRMHTQGRFELMVLFEKLLRELERPQGYFHVRISLLLWTIIERVADETLRNRNVDPSLPASFLTYRRIVNLLEESFTKDRTKAFYEQSLLLKYEYICNLFKKYSGITITTYIQFLRIQQSQDLLRRTDKLINQIAEEVGYEDPFYFSKIFKKTIGMTPTKFREEG